MDLGQRTFDHRESTSFDERGNATIEQDVQLGIKTTISITHNA
jgi:hypothetical protein